MMLYPHALSWRGGRVVECTGLENRQAFAGFEGSNPSLSAIFKGFRCFVCLTEFSQNSVLLTFC